MAKSHQELYTLALSVGIPNPPPPPPPGAPKPKPALDDTEVAVPTSATKPAPAPPPLRAIHQTPAQPALDDTAVAISAPAPSQPELRPSVTPAPLRPSVTAAPPRLGPTLAQPQPLPVGSAKPVFDESEPEFVGRLGGYMLIRKMGEAGPGEVYEARELAQDRIVALKVLSPQLADDPQFAARFTREAYIASQVRHPNLTEILDIAADHGTRFFGTEFVEGQNLAETVQQLGKLDPQAAAGYILQAARGLRFAHQRGIIHRDVKPVKLLLGEDGSVKVDDLGLIQRADPEDKTHQHLPIGTPSFMSPEQAQPDAKLDQRADIYSLGCTFYNLLTGRPPFMGRTAAEVIAKHQNDPVIPPDQIVHSIPRTLSSIVTKMLAKDPDLRSPTMTEVIRGLETFLGVAGGSEAFAPRKEQLSLLESASRSFNSGWSIIRGQIIIAFFIVLVLCAGALGWAGYLRLGAGALLFVLMATLSYQFIAGRDERAHLYLKVRQLLFSSSLVDWLTWVVVVSVILFLLVVSGMFVVGLVAAVAGAFVAAVFHSLIDPLRQRDREPALHEVSVMLKQLRYRGVDETAIRQFVCKWSGRRWEEFYEALFGYDAKMEARRKWGSAESIRPKFAAWREPILRWIDSKLAARKRERLQDVITDVEEQAFLARKVSPNDAARLARRNVGILMGIATEMHGAAKPQAAPSAAEHAEPGGESLLEMAQPQWIDQPSRIEHIESEDEDEKKNRYQRQSWITLRFGSPLDWPFAPPIRFFLGMIILAGFALWWQQSKGDAAYALQLPSLPPVIGKMLSGWNASVAGVILLLSSFARGKLLGLSIYAAAAIALVGHWYPLPDIGQITPRISAIAAGVVAFLGLFFFRVPEGI